MNIRKNKLEKSERRFAGKGLNNSWVGSPGTLGLKKFGPGKLRVKKVWFVWFITSYSGERVGCDYMWPTHGQRDVKTGGILAKLAKGQDFILGLPFHIWPSARERCVEGFTWRCFCLMSDRVSRCWQAARENCQTSHLLFHPDDTPMIYHLSGHFTFLEFFNFQYHHSHTLSWSCW